jgi:CDP-glucose 4,6-dehydratase
VDVSDRFWADRPTLVTGATGLVGSWLVEALLDRGASVVCLVRDQVPTSRFCTAGLASRATLVRGDVRDLSTLERTLGEYAIDTVFHLAAQTLVGVAKGGPLGTLETNVAGTWVLLEACRRSTTVKQIVTASSDKAYGDHGAVAYDEGAPLLGRFPYDVSKACADLIAQGYAATYGLPVAITRCANLFGGGDLNWSRLIPGTIRSLHRAERPVIRSDGRMIRDYLYVEDGVAAYLLLAERLASGPAVAGEAFNFSYERPLTVLDVVAQVAALMGSTLAPDFQNVATGEIPTQRLDASKARDTLGWRPARTFEDGLRRTIAWYRAFLRAAGPRHAPA